MPGGWVGSSRSARLPADWARIRAEVLARDGHRCQLRGPKCSTLATEVDHRQAMADVHTADACQAICTPCHRAKSSAEGNQAKPPRRRPTRPHPGMATHAPSTHPPPPHPHG